ncbi:MAG: hypothetical protein WD278_13185 [Pirellulales bacterium]
MLIRGGESVQDDQRRADGEDENLIDAEEAEAAGHDEAEVASQPFVEEYQNPGVNWFFWIAGLSLVNAAVALTSDGEGRQFVIGLGITAIINGLALGMAQNAAPQVAMIAKATSFALSVLASGVFVGFGILGRKAFVWAIALGMFLYALDGLIYLAYQDWMSFGFHLFALFFLFGALNTAREWQRRQALAWSAGAS